MLVADKKRADLKAFWQVVLPAGDSNYFENDAMEDWVYGNHLGVMTCQVGWNIHEHHLLQAYLDNPFEDGSGLRKGNGWDGLWGLQYTNRTPGRQFVRGRYWSISRRPISRDLCIGIPPTIQNLSAVK